MAGVLRSRPRRSSKAGRTCHLWWGLAPPRQGAHSFSEVPSLANRNNERGRTTSNYRRMARAFRTQCHRENARCWLCDQPIDYTLPPNEPFGFSVDHMEPVSKRPDLAEVYSNFRASHLDCNVRRGNRPPSLDLGTTSRDW